MRDEKDVNSLLKIIKEEVTGGVLVFGDMETEHHLWNKLSLHTWQINLAL